MKHRVIDLSRDTPPHPGSNLLKVYPERPYPRGQALGTLTLLLSTSALLLSTLVLLLALRHEFHIGGQAFAVRSVYLQHTACELEAYP